MNFQVIYVEDQEEDRNRLKSAVRRFNETAAPVTLHLTSAKNLEELREALDAMGDTVDLVLADVWLTIKGKLVDCLSEIIDAVTAPSHTNPIPIIAYTGRGEETLVSCLRRKANLFDIWDKTSASAPYVTWRLSRLAVELSHLRPDTFMHRLIRDMPTGASWHKYVTAMPNSYCIGLTESGQIKSVGADIANIAQELQVWHEPVKEMWEVMTRWEGLSRGVSPTIRGHARHVVNVFWLGYYLIHHKGLSSWFSESWKTLLRERADILRCSLTGDDRRDAALRRAELLSNESSSEHPLESLSNAWYCAGLFHDVAGCVQKYNDLRLASDGLVKKFGGNIDPVGEKWIPDEYNAAGKDLFADFDPDVANELRRVWEQSIKLGKPDHGVIAGLVFRKRVQNREKVNVFEATRAMAMHNLISNLEPRVGPLLSWNREPLVCLHLFCDQLQTWDRERGDEDIFGPDLPSRAQLTFLELQETGAKPKLQIGIDYIIPRHVEHSQVLFERTRRELEEVIRGKPGRALARIGPEWPFHLDVQCSLSGHPLARGN